MKARSPVRPALAASLVAIVALLCAIGIVVSATARYQSGPPVLLAEDLPVADDLKDYQLSALSANGRSLAGTPPSAARGATIVASGSVGDAGGGPEPVFGIIDDTEYLHALTHPAGNGAAFTLSIDTRTLGIGPHTLRVARVLGDEVVHRSAPVAFVIR
jgi:hypothetical protein